MSEENFPSGSVPVAVAARVKTHRGFERGLCLDGSRLARPLAAASW